ncbi:unnamed protein product [Aureobasidium pullulans]|nr:unnamed protein product [Aureobasidium pullulans]
MAYNDAYSYDADSIRPDDSISRRGDNASVRSSGMISPAPDCDDDPADSHVSHSTFKNDPPTTPPSRHTSVRSSQPQTPTTFVPSKKERVRYSWQSIHEDEPNKPRIHVVKIVSNTATASAASPQGEALAFSLIAAYNSARLFVFQTAALPVNVSHEYALRRRPLAVEICDEANVLAVLVDEHTVNVYDLSHNNARRVRTVRTDLPTSTIALSSTGGLLAAAYEGGADSDFNPKQYAWKEDAFTRKSRNDRVKAPRELSISERQSSWVDAATGSTYVAVEKPTSKLVRHITLAAESLEQPYTQGAPRSYMSIERATTAANAHRFQTLEEQEAEADHPGDLPLPAYTELPNQPLPGKYRALAGLDIPSHGRFVQQTSTPPSAIATAPPTFQDHRFPSPASTLSPPAVPPHMNSYNQNISPISSLAQSATRSDYNPSPMTARSGTLRTLRTQSSWETNDLSKIDLAQQHLTHKPMTKLQIISNIVRRM